MIETGGLFEGGGLSNLAKAEVSVLRKELECKTKKLKYNNGSMQQKLKTNSNEAILDQSTRSVTVVID